MTGPEHYQEAERLLSLADSMVPVMTGGDMLRPTQAVWSKTEILAAPQVHAELAHAAATASLAALNGDAFAGVTQAWREVLTGQEG